MRALALSSEAADVSTAVISGIVAIATPIVAYVLSNRARSGASTRELSAASEDTLDMTTFAIDSPPDPNESRVTKFSWWTEIVSHLTLTVLLVGAFVVSVILLIGTGHPAWFGGFFVSEFAAIFFGTRAWSMIRLGMDEAAEYSHAFGFRAPPSSILPRARAALLRMKMRIRSLQIHQDGSATIEATGSSFHEVLTIGISADQDSCSRVEVRHRSSPSGRSAAKNRRKVIRFVEELSGMRLLVPPVVPAPRADKSVESGDSTQGGPAAPAVGER